MLSSQKLEMILNNQQAIFDKARLGYRSYTKQKSACNLYKKSSKENLTCFYCSKLGHKAYMCNLRKNSNSSRSKTIWIIKDIIITNHKGSNKAWIPKST